MEIKSLQEWSKENPGSSVNDYYAYLRKNGELSNIKPVMKNEETYYFPIIENKNESYKSLVTSLIIAFIGILGYFTTWFDSPEENITVTGHAFIQYADVQMHRLEEYKEAAKFINVFYLIPVSYVVVVFGVALRSYLLTGIGTIINFLIVGFIIKFLADLPFDTLPYLGFGLYLVFFSLIGLFYNICTLKI